jgi:hypothetical protein
MCITKSEKGTKLYFHSIDQPGGKIPASIINWGAKKGIPNYLDVVKKACTNCPAQN